MAIKLSKRYWKTADINEHLKDLTKPTAMTVGKKKDRIEFRPLFSGSSSSYRTKLFLKGLHQYIEAHLIMNPGKRLPSPEIAKKYGTTKELVNIIARKVEIHHGLPRRKRGGPNFALPKEAIEIIEQLYKKAKPNSTIRPLDVVEEIARKTGRAIHLNTITKRIRKLNEEGKKNIKFTEAGLGSKPSIDNIAKYLRGKGIEITKIQRRRSTKY